MLNGAEIFKMGEHGTIKVLYAFDGINTPVGRTDINDTSLIMLIIYSGYRILFKDDLNHKLGSYLALHSSDLIADILKVPHHRKNSLVPIEFIKKVKPKFVMIPSPANLWCSKRSSRPRMWFRIRLFVGEHFPTWQGRMRRR